MVAGIYTLITGINIAIVTRTMLLTVTAESTPALESTTVFKEWCGVAQRRRDNARVEIDQMRVIRKAVTGGRLSR